MSVERIHLGVVESLVGSLATSSASGLWRRHA
jgi:hypothetical protein